MLRFKPSTRLRGAAPELVLGVFACERHYARHGFDLTVTSVTDGDHKPGSLHHIGCAVDLRLPPINATTEPLVMQRFVSDLREVLGVEFDVVLEGDHIHVEYDPKR